ncbi:MAG: GNAT family N-acetyltransferase [Desulfobacterales bacterium]|nr:GNAT family N-acetyltransferase [Desulfobacterales bacterium]
MNMRRIRKQIFSLLRYLPKFLRDHICRSRIHIPPLREDLRFEIAKTQKDLDQAFQILHDAYVKEGFSKPHASRRRITDYHALPSTTTLVAKHEGQVVATISVIRDGPFGLPTDQVMDLSRFRDKGERLGEVSSLAIRPDFRGRSGEVMFHLFKYMVHYSLDYFGLDRFVIVVNPERITLYESVLCFTPLHRSALKKYAFANDAPAVCATLNLRRAAQTWFAAYADRPAHQSIYHLFFGGFSEAERRQMRFPERPFYTVSDPVMSPGLLDFFFNKCTDTFCRFKAPQIKALRSIYLENDYAAVWPRQWAIPHENARRGRRFEVACSGMAHAADHNPVALTVMDASRTGLRVRADAELDMDASPVFKIEVGEDKAVLVKARLRWRSGMIYGLEILYAGSFWGQLLDYLEQQFALTVGPGSEPATAVG